MRRSGFLAGVSAALTAGPALAQTTAPIRVATVPFEAGAEPYYGNAMGFFAKAGLNVEVLPISSGAAIAGAVAGGAAEIGFSNIVSIATAHDRGVPVTIVAPASLYSSRMPQTALIVAKSSPLAGAKDLTGKIVAVNGLHSIPEIGTDAWLDKNGGSASAVRYVEMTNSAIGEAVASQRIDAGVLSEPDLSEWLAKDTRALGWIYDAIAPQFIVSAFFTTSGWAGTHPDLIRRYADAVAETARWANANQTASGRVLEAQTKIRIVPGATRVEYGDRLDPRLIQPSIDAAARYKILRAAFPASELLVKS